MRSKKIAGVVILLLSCLYSCDPGIGVAIHNKTNQDKTIQVLYPANFRFPGDSGQSQYNLCIRDSIKTFNLMVQDNDLPPIVIPMTNWDTVARTYSFILKANHGAVLESRFLAAFPTFGQVFIINQSDTITLNKDGKDFIKRPKLFIGGSWTHSIKD